MARQKRNGPIPRRRPVVPAARQPRPAPPPAAEPASRFPASPATLVMAVLMGLVVLGGHLAARYVDDPALIPHPWRTVTAVVAAVVVFLAVSTLTQLTTVLMVPVPSARGFLTHVGEFSAVGAILGTALGFRMGEHLFVQAGRDPARYGFPDLLATISDAVTLMTLLTIALCWVRAAALGRDLVRAVRESGRLPGRAAYAALLLIAAGNYIGLQAGAFVYRLLAT